MLIVGVALSVGVVVLQAVLQTFQNTTETNAQPPQINNQVSYENTRRLMAEHHDDINTMRQHANEEANDVIT